MYADALAANKQYSPAIQTLKQAQRILAASNNARSDYDLRIAEFYNALGKKDSVVKYLQPFLNGKTRDASDDELRYVRLLAATGNLEQALTNFKIIPAKGDRFYQAGYFYTHGKIMELCGQKIQAVVLYEKAIAANPYLFNAYADLIRSYEASGQRAKVDALQLSMASLQIKPGPGYQNLNP
jgi:tetratricopeptide (TPR) repeat protein